MEALFRRPCIGSPVTEQDRSTFPTLQHLQRYHSGLETFTIPEGTTDASLPHPYHIVNWASEKDRHHTVTLQDESGVLTEGRAFVKTVHLLDPVGLLYGDYIPCCPAATEPGKRRF